jgi:hypothetical protein
MSKFLRAAALAACVGGAMAIAPAGHAQQTQIRAAQPAAPTQQGQMRTETCAKVEVHLNELGTAFACFDARGEAQIMVVVDEQGFAGRIDHLRQMLMTAEQAVSGSARGTGKGIIVTMTVATNPKDRLICTRTRAIAGNLPCYSAFNLTKRS